MERRRYKHRNQIKRMFGFIKHQHRVATRYHKTVLSYLNSFNPAAIQKSLPHFVSKRRLSTHHEQSNTWTNQATLSNQSIIDFR